MPADANVDWTTVGYVTDSDYRMRAVDALTDSPVTHTELGERTNLDITPVSRTLTELRDRVVVELLVLEERPKGRIYGLSETGEQVAAEVDV